MQFFAGAALGLGLHESGHLVLDEAFGAHPGVRKVSAGFIPFFAITHEPVSPLKEFTISSAGFWVQHAGSEILLMRRPNLRDEHAPFAKGLLAFNVLTSVMYAGAAFARTGPAERDTRGMAVSADIAEPWIGVDDPGTRRARWRALLPAAVARAPVGESRRENRAARSLGV